MARKKIVKKVVAKIKKVIAKKAGPVVPDSENVLSKTTTRIVG